MQVVVEFLGVPRRLAGVAETTVETADGTDLRALLGLLRDRFPALSPAVITADGPDLLAPYILSIDGRRTPHDLAERLREGERVLLLSSLAGG